MITELSGIDSGGSIGDAHEMNNPFRFKQFAVHQNLCAMKVGTDGILLGAWAQAAQPNRILDIGTGTGLIALMMAKRFPNAIVEPVEIESNAAEQELGRFFNKRFLTPFCRFFVVFVVPFCRWTPFFVLQ